MLIDLLNVSNFISVFKVSRIRGFYMGLVGNDYVNFENKPLERK